MLPALDSTPSSTVGLMSRRMYLPNTFCTIMDNKELKNKKDNPFISDLKENYSYQGEKNLTIV